MTKPAKPPTIRFTYPQALHSRVVKMLDTIDASEDPAAHSEAFGNVVVELTEAGLNYFFIKPLEMAKAGFMLRQACELGLAGTQRMMFPVIRSTIGRLNGDELRAVAEFLRSTMK